MSLLLSSERVYAEMIDWLEFGEPEQLVFRQFDEVTVAYAASTPSSTFPPPLPLPPPPPFSLSIGSITGL